MSQEIEKNILKTGTTTLGLVCKDGIVLAADKRMSYGGEGGVSLVAGKNAQKVVPINDKLVVTTAGVVSDIQFLIKLIRAELRLKEIKSKEEPSTGEAVNLLSSLVYQNIRKFSAVIGIAHFLVAGRDSSGASLYEVGADGSVSKIEDFVASGSGTVLVYGLLESEYKKHMSVEDGVKLAVRAINSSMKRDPGTGEGLDVFTITEKEIKQVLAQEVETMFVDKKK
jgi:proteasome beta subunit